MRILVALALFVAATAPDAAGDGYRFVLDGKEIDPRRIAVEGTPDTLAPGDVVLLSGIWITLGEPGEYVLRDRRGRLYREGPDGSTLLGLRHRAVSRRPSLSDEDLASIRGICIAAKAPGCAELLARLDPGRTCVELEVAGARAGLIRLPPGLVRLVLEGPLPPGRIRSLRNQTKLRMLVIRRGVAHLEDLRASTGLRRLDAPKARIESPDALDAMTELRWLDLDGAEGLDSVDFARKMPALRRLWIRGTAVTDLSPLSGHTALEDLRVSGSPVRTLPAGRLPRIRTVEGFRTELPREAWLAFAAHHPGRTIDWSRAEMLRRVAARSDRLRVRTGGMCCRSPEKEKTICEVEGRAIEALLARVEIDEGRSGGECMCCGELTFEFREGESLVAGVSFHHGHRLRWSGWKGDSELTVESALAVTGWLSRHGVSGPGEALRRGLLAQRAFRRRWEAIEEILPEGLFEAVCDAEGQDAHVALLEGAVDTPAGRARLCFRLLGCHEGDWNWTDTLDGACLACLDATEGEPEALRGIGDDPAARKGAARWLFAGQACRRIPRELRDEVLPELAREGLSHPGPWARRRVMNDLGRVGGDTARTLLREVLAGTLVPRTLGPDDSTSFGGMVRARGEKGDVDAASDRVVAAILLARMHDRESLPAIRALLEEADERDRPRLEQAMRSLRR